MKKVILKLFLLIIALSCSKVCAETINNSDTNAKNATINDIEFVKIYDVELFWGEMKFSFNETENYAWDNDIHEYYSKINKKWTSTGNTVTIHNKSNYEIKANLVYEGNNEYSNITGVFSKKLLNIGINKTENSKLSLSGNLASNVKNYTKIGTIIITIY